MNRVASPVPGHARDHAQGIACGSVVAPVPEGIKFAETNLWKVGVGSGGIELCQLESSLDWDSQLDAETFRRWRATRPSSNDRVQRLGNHQLVLDTVFSTGQVSEAHLTVRIPDYHAIEESFRFQDHSEIEIAELSYDVVPLAAVPGDIFRALPPPAVAQLPTGATLGSVLPSNAELAKAELQAEVVLHGINADLGEQINITANVDREVLIEGIVEGDARKQQLQSALQGVPHTHLHLLTIDEAAHQPPSPSVARVAQTADSSVQVMVAAPPLLESRLNVRFPDKDQRAAYVNQALSLAS